MKDCRMAISRSDVVAMCLHCCRGVKVLIDVQTESGDVWFCTMCATRIGTLGEVARGKGPRRIKKVKA